MKAHLILFVVLFIPILVQSNLCKTGCSDCPSYDSCSYCYFGYSFIPNTSECRSCPQKCGECSFDSEFKATCLICAPQYGIMSPTGNCEKCDQRCHFCVGRPENCTSCYAEQVRTLEYTHDDGPIYLCQKNPFCDDSCYGCSPLAGGLCTSCRGDQVLFTGGCIACNQSCESCSSDLFGDYFAYVMPYLQELQAFYSNPPRNNGTNSTNSSNSSNETVELPPLDVITLDYQNIDYNSVDIEYLILHKFLYDQMSPNQTLTQDERYTISSQIMNKHRKNRHLPFSQRISMMEDDLEELANISSGNLLEDLKDSLFYCEYCTQGNKYVNETCVKCPANCQYCSEDYCNYCKQTYALNIDQSGCIPCEPPCLSCGSFNKSQCYSCLPPYTMNTYGECMQCEKPCETCQTGSPTSCQICMRPYSKFSRNGTNECFTCADFDCLVCDEDNPQICYECLENLALDGDNTCKQCSSHCEECDLSTGSEVCFKCEEGYFSTDSGCQVCGGGGCKICSLSDSSSCLECEEGLYLDANKKCKICPEQCSTCENDQECLDYADGKVEVDGVVLDCKLGCNDCIENPEMCGECADKYYLDEGYCYKCSSGCQRCSSANDCIQCQFGFVSVSGACQKCDSSCLQCQADDPTICTTCKKGLTLNQGNCTFSCEQGCFDCDPNNATHCYECVEGYTLKSNGECVKCLSSCSGYCDPSDVTVCLGCSEGFQLKDNECVRCPEGCSSCSQGSCSDCYSGYSIAADGDDFVCEKDCKFPCTQCDDEGDVCSECASMFNFTNGLCVPDTSCNPSCSFCPAGTIRNDGTNNCDECSSNCASCNQQMDCLECFSGYYLDSNSSTCEPCTSNCDICASSEVCEQCEAGYLLVLMSETDDLKVYDSVCSFCDNNCLECIEQPNVCTSCNDTHKLKNTKCIGRYTVGFVFVFNKDFNTFLEESDMQNFILRISIILQINIDLIFINNLYEGSTIIEGSVSSENLAEAEQRSAVLQENEDNLGFEVLSSNVDVYYDDSVYGEGEEEEEEETEDVPVGAIVGGVVGGLAVIGIVVFVVYKKNKTQTVLTDSGELHEHHEKEKTVSKIVLTNGEIVGG